MLFQFAIGLLGLLGLWMVVQKRSQTIREFASWVNLPLQPPWLWTLYNNGDWGFLIVGLGYAFLWVHEFAQSFGFCARTIRENTATFRSPRE